MSYDAKHLLKATWQHLRRTMSNRQLRLRDCDAEEIVGEVLMRLVAEFDPKLAPTPMPLMRFRVCDVLQEFLDNPPELAMDPMVLEMTYGTSNRA